MQLPLLESLRLAELPPQFETGPRSIRAVRVLRVSVTDRCNFRCVYCMPADGVEWMPRVLSDDELIEIIAAGAAVHEIRRIKLTGGEPTVRPGIVDLVRRLRDAVELDDISLTTNGFALEKLARPLREAGLDRVTVSLDSLDATRFKRITRTGDLATVLRGLHAAVAAGFRSVKVNCVTMRGTNDDEFGAFARLARELPISVRFIEYMPLGTSTLLGDESRASFTPHAEYEPGPVGGCGAQARGQDAFISETDVRMAIEREHGPLVAIDRETESGVGPAVPYGFAAHPDAPGRLGFISAMSAPFCATCNRLRLTANGQLRSCLFEGGEVDLRPTLALPADQRQQALADAMERCVRLKPVVHSQHGNEQMSRIGG